MLSDELDPDDSDDPPEFLAAALDTEEEGPSDTQGKEVA